MAWTLKSDKTGQEYDFEDDVEPAKALQFVKMQEQDQAWGNVAETIPRAVQTGFLKAQSGLLTAAEDFIAKPLQRLQQGLMDPLGAMQGTAPEVEGSPMAQTARERSKAAQDLLRKETIGTPSTLQKGVTSAAVSLAEAVPDVVAGAGAAVGLARAGVGTAQALGTALETGLVSAATREGAREYTEQREAGIEPGRAAVHAVASGVAEYIPEKFAFTPILKLLKSNDPGIVGAVGNFLGREMLGEQVTTGMQWLNRKLSRDPDTTLADLWEEAKVTAVAAGVGGPVQGALTGATFQVALRERAEREMTQPWVEPIEGTIPKGTAETAIQSGEQDVEVQAPGKKPFIRDEDLPIVGEQSPEGMETTSRQLDFNSQLELLRRSYETYKGLGFQSTAEDRIRARGDFLTRRAQIENILVENPEQRAFLLTADLEMGIRQPEVRTDLELDVIRTNTLSEEALLARQEGAAFEGTDDPEAPPAGILEALGMRVGTTEARPTIREDLAFSRPVMDKIQSTLVGRTVQYASDPKLKGVSFEALVDQMEPGTVAFVGETSVDLTMNRARDIVTDLVTRLANVMVPQQKYVIAWETDPRLGGSATSLPYEQNTQVLFIRSVRSLATSNELFDVSAAQTQIGLVDAQAPFVDAVLHEFTHTIHLQHWRDTPASEKKSVAAEYHADLQKAADPKSTARDVLQTLYSPHLATVFEKVAERAGIDVKKPGSFLEIERAGLGPFSKPDYWFNFSEWMAHKGVKYFTTRLGVNKENVGFFQRFVAKMRQLWAQSLSYLGTGPAFAQWLENIAARESGLVQSLTTKEMNVERDRLVAEGMQPELARLFVIANKDKQGVLRRMGAQLRQGNATEQIERNARKLWKDLTGAIKTGASFESISKAVEKTTLGQDLLAHPLMREESTRNGLELFNAFFQRGYGKYFSSHGTANGFNVTFRLNREEMVVQYNAQANTLFVYDENLDGGAATAIELAVALQAMRVAATRGRTDIQLVGFSPEVLRTLNAEEVDEQIYVAQLPYFVHREPIGPMEHAQDRSLEDVMPEMRIPAGLANLGQKLGTPFLQSSANSLGRFNAFFEKTLGAYQLIKLNPEVPGMVEEKQALRNRMAYRHKWLKLANSTVENWAFGMEKTQAAKLSKLLFDEAESGKWLGIMTKHPSNPGEYIFQLDPAEVTKRGLETKAVELYSQVRSDFMRFAEEWQKVGLWEISRNEMDEAVHQALAEAMRTDLDLTDYKKIVNIGVNKISDPVRLAAVKARVDALNQEFETWKAKPYMPYTRFGRWGVLVRDRGTKGTKYFAGYDTKKEAQAAAKEIQKSFPQDVVSQTYLEDIPYMMAGLPPSIVDSMKNRMGLSDAQQAAFSEVLAQLSHANSFVHRAQKKTGVEGYTKDALRAYSDYFRRGSAYLARIKSEPELNDAMNLLKRYMNRLTSSSTEPVDVSNLGRLHEWFTRHHQYLNDVGNEYGEVKSFMALWHFGFNAATALTNLSQVPLVTVPYLTARYKLGDVLGEFIQAYKDVATLYAKKSRLPADEEAMLNHALEQGFRDESQATVIAQIADGSALARATPFSAWRRGLNTTNHYAMWLFSKTELVNRDATLLTAYRLHKKNSPGVVRNGFDQSAFDFARTTTEDTHNEYSRENRPEIMRGAGSVIFQFMHFAQNMAFLQLGGDKSWWRLLLMQGTFAGMLGLPFAGDLKEGIKFIGRSVFGKDWDMEREAREYVSAVGADPDLVLRGLASDVFGFDLSRRISMGEIVPGMKALGSHRKLEQVAYDVVGDAGGPAAGLLLNLFGFIAEDDKMTWQAISKVLPTSMKNLGKAAKAFESGKVTDRSGAVLIEPSTWDVLGMAVGWQPEKLSEEYQARTLEHEKAAYWTQRRQNLLHIWGSIVVERDKDREVVADFMKRLQEFNREAPDPSLLIKGSTLRQSAKRRLQANVQKEAGLGATPAMRQSTQEIRSTFRSLE